MGGRVAPPPRPRSTVVTGPGTAAAGHRGDRAPRGADDRGPREHRELTSYVRRSGRMTAGQKRAWDMYAHRFVVPVPTRPSGLVPPTAPLDRETLFGRRAPLVVEIGPGMGDSLVAMAADRPDTDLIAFEVYHASVAAIVHKLAAAGVSNVRLIMADAVSGLEHLIAPGELDELWTFFPDPWHKTRHHKRRLVQTAFADLVADRLRPGGVWRLATDWQDYADWMHDVLSVHPRLVEADPGSVVGTGRRRWAPRYEGRPLTKFEARGVTEGRTVRDLAYRRP